MEWFTVEVLNGVLPASAWQRGYGEILVEAALTHGAGEWSWQLHPWGVALELLLPDQDAWESYQALPAVAAALDAVPDRVNGLLLYRGRGGSSGRPAPRRPRPIAGSGAAELPEPVSAELASAVAEATTSGLVVAVRPALRVAR